MSGVTLLRVTPGVTWTQPFIYIYIYIYILCILDWHPKLELFSKFFFFFPRCTNGWCNSIGIDLIFLVTKLANYACKERKFSKCGEIFNDIINQGREPCESTFHLLIVAYLSSSIQGYLEEACSIYNRMIQLGGYLPRLSLHNSLFRALVSQPGASSKHYLKQAWVHFSQWGNKWTIDTKGYLWWSYLAT